jgi:hypothetical protein
MESVASISISVKGERDKEDGEERVLDFFDEDLEEVET